MYPSASIIKQSVALFALMLLVCSSVLEAKLLRRSRIYDDSLSGYGGLYAGGATGERAILTVRGVRSPYDGSAPNKIAIEDNSYRGPYPRGVYDRLDSGYGGRGGYLMYPQGDYSYNSNYGGGNYGGYQHSGIKRRDFLDPDFGFKASLNLANKQRSKCKLNTQGDSEIPELGLDSGRLNIDCDINPVRVADAALRMATKYRQQQPYRSDSRVKRKRTRININSEYERARNQQPADGGGDDSDQSADLNGEADNEDDDD